MTNRHESSQHLPITLERFKTMSFNVSNLFHSRNITTESTITTTVRKSTQSDRRHRTMTRNNTDSLTLSKMDILAMISLTLRSKKTGPFMAATEFICLTGAFKQLSTVRTMSTDTELKFRMRLKLIRPCLNFMLHQQPQPGLKQFTIKLLSKLRSTAFVIPSHPRHISMRNTISGRQPLAIIIHQQLPFPSIIIRRNRKKLRTRMLE